MARDLNERDIEILRKLAPEIVEMERRLSEKDEERTKQLHDRLNDILGDLREIRGELNKS